MNPLFRPRVHALRRQAGIGIVTAIFLLVVLAGLGVAIVSITTGQQNTVVQDQQAARAYQAARAGVEWALYQALQAQSNADPAVNLGCPATYSFRMPSDTTLSAFTVTVSCGTPVKLAGATYSHFLITSTACNEPANGACPNASRSPDYVQRVVQAQL
ncbi:agglutinin biogenesis protein MshP [Oxalobacteraceae bacterium A2-2]